MKIPTWEGTWRQADDGVRLLMVGVLTTFHLRHKRNAGGRRNCSLARTRRIIRSEVAQIRDRLGGAAAAAAQKLGTNQQGQLLLQ